MRGQSIPIRPRRNVLSFPEPASGREELTQQLSGRLVGQAHAIAEIVPYVQMYRAGLGPEGRPAGVFLLLGPTGTGKTRTVEALAEALHAEVRGGKDPGPAWELVHELRGAERSQMAAV